MLVAPTEPSKLRAIGHVSLLPESFGSDFMFPTVTGLAGIQRKEISDFVASVRDGRLGKEIVQMQRLAHRYLILEGRLSWTNSGILINSRIEWSKGQHYSSLMSVQDSGVALLTTESLSDTSDLIRNMEKWLQKDSHSRFLTKPKATGEWGKATSEDWGAWLLQSFDGIGLKTARAIYRYFNGIPLKWTTTEQELMQVDGVGKIRAKAMIESLAKVESAEQDDFPLDYEEDVV